MCMGGEKGCLFVVFSHWRKSGSLEKELCFRRKGCWAFPVQHYLLHGRVRANAETGNSSFYSLVIFFSSTLPPAWPCSCQC